MGNYFYLPCGVLVWQNLIGNLFDDDMGRLYQYNNSNIVAVFRIKLKAHAEK